MLVKKSQGCQQFFSVSVTSFTDVLFNTGDFRTDENIALSAQQTLWFREHNRIADTLKRINPGWDDETIFQEARRITIAEYQHIIYNEFLPPLVGKSEMTSYCKLVE